MPAIYKHERLKSTKTKFEHIEAQRLFKSVVTYIIFRKKLRWSLESIHPVQEFKKHRKIN